LLGFAALLVVVPGTQAQAPAKTAKRAAAPAADGRIRHVVIISVDGMRPQTYTEPDAHGLRVPTLRRLVREGASSDGARSVLPAVTYPAHTSIVTGANPGTHGITYNGPYNPEGRLTGMMRWYAEDIRVPTLWDAARARGLRTASVYWPVTVGARMTAIVPEFWRTEDEGSVEDQKMIRAISTPGLLEGVARRFPGFWERFRPVRVDDEAGADLAVHLIETLKPNLLLLHMFDVDHVQHDKGAFSPEGNVELEQADAQIARVIEAAKRAGTWASTALVIVSDHGFTPFRTRVRPGVWMAQEGLVTLDERNRIQEYKAWLQSNSGGSAYVFLKDKNDQATADAVFHLFRAVAGKPGSGVRRMFVAQQIRQMGGDPEAFLALEPAENYEFVNGYFGDVVSQPTNETRAGHGGLPDNPIMNTSLIFYGPSIAPGKVEGARLIDVAPTVARWLGLRFDKAEGQPLPVPRASFPK
jgi:predicted AlkP superfamily pyrophosphatase or phosphodiesterase